MGREFELKYAATPAQQARILADFPLSWKTIAMETTYYDTPAGDLGRLRWTLRRRYENGTAVCTLKTPGENGGRGEWELECPAIEEAVPGLCKLSGIRELLLLAEAGLIPVCGARFTRQAGSLKAEGCTLELAVDSGVLLGGGRELPLCEIEAELKDGSEEAAVTFAAGLAAKYGLTAEPRSKYRRALMIGKGEL